ncbi:hypothetical protein BDW69DRAFT_202833 [Aspergillus filifer]
MIVIALLFEQLPPTPPSEDDISLSTINDILLQRTSHPPDVPLVGYPQSSHGISDYTFYTAKDVGRFANGSVHALKASGLANISGPIQNRVVAILGPSNLDCVVVLLLSTRLSTEAYVNLLEKTNCSHILFSPATEKAVVSIRKTVPTVKTFLIPDYSIYSACTERSKPESSEPGMSRKWAFSIHSSGSTGLPKPIFQTHAACIANYTTSNSYRALLTLPLYHNHGLCTFFRSLFKAKPIAIYNADLPLTGKNFLEVMEAFRPESFHGVPYVLKLLSEVHGGVEALAQCQQVLFGGSSCPDDLGDYLVEKEVRLISHYGATELGQLMTSDRPVGDKLWNYVQLEDGSYECIALDGLPAKVSSNCDDPPNSFHTQDTFLKHPSKPNAWKYLGRIDDRVTLINGEKVLPVPIEHRIRHSKFVQDNLVFGVGKPLPGLIVVPSAECQALSKTEILDAVWPDIEAANQNAEAFSQIPRDMVIILDVGATYSATDKGTMIRNRSYNEFSHLIEVAYQNLEDGDLEDYLLKLFHTKLGLGDIELSSDLFEAGVDSLQAIKARGFIKKDIDIGQAELGHNVVFDFANIKKLAAHLHALRTGEEQDEEDEFDVMSQLVGQYSSFLPRPRPEEVILMQRDSVKKIYCLVRASDTSNALDRVLSRLASRPLPMVNVSKIIALPSQLSAEDLGPPSSILSELRASLTKVIHSAWAVNFTLGVCSFEAQHIKGLNNLVNLCLSSKRPLPAELYFCSSISAAAGTPLPATIAEAPILEFAHAQGMGYARSKLVAERIVQAAAERTGMIAKVLRVGQIVGDTIHGKWNTTEAIPLMLQTAQTLKALPALDETPQFSHDPRTIYHVQNAKTFRWTEELLPALQEAGLDFEILPKRQWVHRLRDGEQDPKKNTAIKLLDFFVEKYDNDNPGRSGLVFEMEKSQVASPTLRGGVDLIESGLIRKFVEAWRTEW